MQDRGEQYWKVFCDEDTYPGLWRNWYRAQCVAVGWPPPRWKLREPNGSKGWSSVARSLQAMRPGDHIVVHLRNHCVGRVGEVVRACGEDADWNPFIPPESENSSGEVGRRVHVRWALDNGPSDPDLIVKLPVKARMRGKYLGTIRRLTRKEFERVSSAMSEPANWVPVASRFAHETALSDFIATFPHHLEDGLIPHPSKRVREMRFADGGRSDVILEDRDGATVVVECKQGAPSEAHAKQLLRYARQLRRRARGKVRAILVHGGATKLPRELQRWRGKVEFVQYRLSVGFAVCR